MMSFRHFNNSEFLWKWSSLIRQSSKSPGEGAGLNMVWTARFWKGRGMRAGALKITTTLPPPPPPLSFQTACCSVRGKHSDLIWNLLQIILDYTSVHASLIWSQLETTQALIISAMAKGEGAEQYSNASLLNKPVSSDAFKLARKVSWLKMFWLYLLFECFHHRKEQSRFFFFFLSLNVVNEWSC